MKQLLVGIVVLATAAAGHAHEFLIKPGKISAAGDALPFTVESTHVFMQSEEMEAADTVTVSLRQGDKTEAITLQENEAAQRLEGEIVMADDASAYLLGHRLGQVWSQTPKGWKPGGRDVNADAQHSNKFEKFAKTLLNASPSDTAFATPAGHRLEIVPVTNPATVKVGEDLVVQVLYDGKPLATEVLATYDGFTETPSSYAYFTETYRDDNNAGLAKVRISTPGLWLVRVEHRASKSEEGIDEHVMRAVLVFEVAPVTVARQAD